MLKKKPVAREKVRQKKIARKEYKREEKRNSARHTALIREPNAPAPALTRAEAITYWDNASDALNFVADSDEDTPAVQVQSALNGAAYWLAELLTWTLQRSHAEVADVTARLIELRVGFLPRDHLRALELLADLAQTNDMPKLASIADTEAQVWLEVAPSDAGLAALVADTRAFIDALPSRRARIRVDRLRAELPADELLTIAEGLAEMEASIAEAEAVEAEAAKADLSRDSASSGR